MLNVSIRKAKITDANIMINFVNKVSDETDYLTAPSNERNITLDTKSRLLGGISKNKKSVMFIALCNDEIVASCHMHAHNASRVNHRAEFGLSVLKKYWGRGIGSALIINAINYARNNDITKIDLIVREDNKRAIALYKKFNFELEGRIKNYFYLNNRYYDAYFMGIILKKID